MPSLHQCRTLRITAAAGCLLCASLALAEEVVPAPPEALTLSDTAVPADDPPPNGPEPSVMHGRHRLFGILDEFGIPHDPDVLETAALRAMLRAIDPQAALLTTDEAETLEREQTGYRPRGNPGASAAHVEDGIPLPPEPIPSMTTAFWPHDIVYIAVSGLFDGADDQFSETMGSVIASNAAGLIIDLRHAGGRNFDAVDRIAGFFIAAGTPLYTLLSADGKPIRQGVSVGNNAPQSAPILVLIGAQTVMAAELLAAVLRDSRGVMLLGERTRGDLGLRELYRWSEDFFAYLPTARFRPEGYRDDHPRGTAPHITIPASRSSGDDAQEGPRGFPACVGTDPILLRAVDILVGLRAVRRSTPDD